MKKLFLASFMIFGVSMNANASGPYLSVAGGFNFNSSEIESISFKDDYKNSPYYSVAVGYDMPALPTRFEIEGFYNKSDAKNLDNDLEAYGLMANGYLRVPIIGVYAGAGLGYGKFESETKPLFQAMVGVEYGFDILSVGLEYRHIETFSDVEKNYDKISYKADVLLAKLRFGF